MSQQELFLLCGGKSRETLLEKIFLAAGLSAQNVQNNVLTLLAGASFRGSRGTAFQAVGVPFFFCTPPPAAPCSKPLICKQRAPNHVAICLESDTLSVSNNGCRILSWLQNLPRLAKGKQSLSPSTFRRHSPPGEVEASTQTIMRVQLSVLLALLVLAKGHGALSPIGMCEVAATLLVLTVF